MSSVVGVQRAWLSFLEDSWAPGMRSEPLARSTPQVAGITMEKDV